MIYKLFPYKELDHKTVLLYGFHFSFILVYFISIIPDYILESMLSFYIDISALIITLVSYYLLHFKKKILLSKIIITFLAVISVTALLYVNQSSHFDIIYITLLPFIPFYLFRLKEALVLNTIIYILIFSVLYYIYINNPNDPITHNHFAIMNITLTIILIMFFGIFYHYGIESSLYKLQKSNQQKDMLLKEVHHRVKNNLNLTASMIGLQAMGESTQIKEHLFKSKSRIEAIATIHEMLYQYNNFQEINLYDYIQKLENLLLRIYANKKIYTLLIDVPKDLTLPLDIMVQFGLMINEMLTNTIKHATHKENLIIKISLTKQHSNYIFTYSDNGEEKVEDTNLQNSKGIGIKLITLSIKQLDGKLKTYYNKGLYYEVSFTDAKYFDSGR